MKIKLLISVVIVSSVLAFASPTYAWDAIDVTLMYPEDFKALRHYEEVPEYWTGWYGESGCYVGITPCETACIDYWTWDFSGGTVYQDPDPPPPPPCNLSDQKSVRYNATGLYDITVRGTDSEGLWGEDTVVFTVFEMLLGMSGVSDASEEDPGGYIAYNDDDDNLNGVPDFAEAGEGTLEDDLVALTIERSPVDLGGWAELRIPSSGVKVWSDAYKTAGGQLIPYSGYCHRRWANSDLPKTVWLEGCTTGPSLGLQLYFSTTNPDPQYTGSCPDGIYNPDKVNVTGVQVDMDMDGVDDEKEESLGGYIPLGDEKGITLRRVEPQADMPFDSSHPMTLDVEYGGRGGAGTIQLLDYSDDPGNPVEISWPKTYKSPAELPTDLKVKGTETSPAQRLITLIWRYNIAGITVEDRIKLTVVEVNLTIEGVEEDDEDTVGGYVSLNNDDDNLEGTPDNDEEATVAHEDNLVKIELSLAPPFDRFPGKVRLEVPYGQDEIRVWADADKGTRVLPTAAGNNYIEWYPADTDPPTNDKYPDELYVEGYSYVGGTCDLTLAYRNDYIGPTLAEDSVKFRIIDIKPYTDATNLLDDWPKTATQKRSPKYIFGQDDPIYVEVKNLGIDPDTAETFTDIAKVESDSGGVVDLTLKETGVNTNIFDNIAAAGELLYISDVTGSGAGDNVGVVDEEVLKFSLEIQPDSGSYDSAYRVMVDRGEFATGSARSFDSLMFPDHSDWNPRFIAVADGFKNGIVDPGKGNLDWWGVGEVRGSYSGDNVDLANLIKNAGEDIAEHLESDVLFIAAHGSAAGTGSLAGTKPSSTDPTTEVWDYFLSPADVGASGWDQDLDWAVIYACHVIGPYSGGQLWKENLKHLPRQAHGICGFAGGPAGDYTPYMARFMDEIGARHTIISSWIYANTAGSGLTDQPYSIVYHYENGDDCFRKASEGPSLTPDVKTSDFRFAYRDAAGQEHVITAGFDGDIEEGQKEIEVQWEGQAERQKIRFGRTHNGLQKIRIAPHRFEISELAEGFTLVREYESGLLIMSRNLDVNANSISKNEAVRLAQEFVFRLGLNKKDTKIETSPMYATGGVVMGYIVNFIHSFRGCVLAGDHVTLVVQSDGIKLISAFWHDIEAVSGRHKIGDFRNRDLKGVVGALRRFYLGIDEMPNIEYVRPVYNVFDPDTTEPGIVWDVCFKNGKHVLWDGDAEEAPDFFKNEQKQRKVLKPR